jgi:hypothetical protein
MALEPAHICVRMYSKLPKGFVLQAAVWQRQGFILSAKEALENVMALEKYDDPKTNLMNSGMLMVTPE